MVSKTRIDPEPVLDVENNEDVGPRESPEDHEDDRFTINSKGVMTVGKSIYRELVEKMLSVHIAFIERRIRACQRCKPRCVGGMVKDPYSRDPKRADELPSYLQNYLKSRGITDTDTKKGKRALRAAEELENTVR